MNISTHRIPVAVKMGFSIFMLVLVPFYWRTYGPTNFLYFCDVALFLTLIAVWTEKPLYTSLAAVGILLPQFLWVTDFLLGLAGFHPLGMTEYMFDPKIPLFARGLSLFHGWLPFLLLYLVYKLGYDQRAFVGWTMIAWLLMLTCYFLMPMPGTILENTNAPVNINYVFGLSDAAPQSWLPQSVYFTLMMVGLPLLVYLPSHIMLKKVFKRAPIA